MNMGISRMCCPGFLINWAWGCENVLEGLELQALSMIQTTSRSKKKTYRNKKTTPKQTIPWVLSIICVVSIQENWPLITRDLDLPTHQLPLDAATFSRLRPICLVTNTNTCTQSLPILVQPGKEVLLYAHGWTHAQIWHYGGYEDWEIDLLVWSNQQLCFSSLWCHWHEHH